MCLIIARKMNTEAIPENYIRNASRNNPDGFGIVAKHGESVITLKDVEMKSTLDAIRDLEKANAEFVAHFRYRTHGEIDEENTHPFKLAGENYLAHNGQINIATPQKGKSDTWHFAESIIRSKVAMRPANLLRFFEKRAKLLAGSKLAILGADVPLTIYGESLGTWINGIWYSNVYSLAEPVTRYADYSGYSWSSGGRKASGFSREALLESDLETLSTLSHFRLSYLLENYPDEMAELIQNHFDELEYAEYMKDDDAEHLSEDDRIWLSRAGM
jgi:hypothetical protein